MTLFTWFLYWEAIDVGLNVFAAGVVDFLMFWPPCKPYMVMMMMMMSWHD